MAPHRTALSLVLLAAAATATRAQIPHPPTMEDIVTMPRVSDPQVSPDGRFVVYTVSVASTDTNASDADIWVVPVEGGEPRRLTTSLKSESSPRWSPDGASIAFLSSRGGSRALWILPVAGGEARRILAPAGGFNGFQWLPDGSGFLFGSTVPEGKTTGLPARIIDNLLYRHWDSFTDGKRNHLFIRTLGADGDRDLTPPGHDVPPFSLGGPQDFDIAPDGTEVCFAMKPDPVPAISTNSELHVVPAAGGEPRRISTSPGGDFAPRYSPDGRHIAFLSQERAGYESDRLVLFLHDRSTGRARPVTADFDRSILSFIFAPDGRTIYAVTEEEGRRPIYRIPLEDGAPVKLHGEGVSDALGVTPDGKTLVFLNQSAVRPPEVHAMDAGGGRVRRLTRTCDEALSRLHMNLVEDVWYTGAGGDRVHALVVKPPGHDPTEKSPLLLLCHGGPQGAWLDSFSTRWNVQVFASRGAIVLMPNFHGSTGYGQAFTDSIRHDWGGKPYEDLMLAVDHMVATGLADENRLAAAGGSFGGYMVNWINGKTDRFKALIAHAGSFNHVSKYGVTEELWFQEWEFGGTPWDNPTLYETWSPYTLAARMRTPTLVIHGELDYRVPVGEALQTFTCLRRQGVRARLLHFPDEGHWILKPCNAVLWMEEILDWLDTHWSR